MVPNHTIFHVTNHKAGSQWVAEILKYIEPDRFVIPKVKVSHFVEKPVVSGKIYPTLYIPKQEFFSTLLGYPSPHTYYPSSFKNFFTKTINKFYFYYRENPYRIVIIIRDLRDILISMYFSWLISHTEKVQAVANDRKILSTMSLEEGLLYLMKVRLPLEAAIQQSWWLEEENNCMLRMRFEDILKNEHQCFIKIIKHCQIDVDEKKMHDIVSHNSFHNVTGREPGQENIQSHLRKGIAGDWGNYFTDRVKKEFKEQFGNVLINTGYEQDMNW